MYACFNEAGKADGLRTRKIIPDNGESYITGERQYNNGTLEVVKTSNCRTGEIAAKNIGLYERYNSKIRFPDLNPWDFDSGKDELSGRPPFTEG